MPIWLAVTVFFAMLTVICILLDILESERSSGGFFSLPVLWRSFLCVLAFFVYCIFQLGRWIG